MCYSQLAKIQLAKKQLAKFQVAKKPTRQCFYLIKKILMKYNDALFKKERILFS